VLEKLNCFVRSVRMKTATTMDSSTYPFNIPALKDLGQLDFHPRITFFVGENGSGKSTLLEALAMSMGFGPEGGTKNVQLSTTNSVSILHEHLVLARGIGKPKDGFFLRAESFFNIATYMDEVGYLQSYGGKSLHHRSHGEAFLTLLSQKFRGNGIYLLDEPEAALSPARQLTALRCIRQLVTENSQFIIATHSPILLAYPDAKMLHFSSSGIEETSYEQTDHYAITKDFLNNYRSRIERLFED
jgi:predicted ATPase